MNTTNEVVAEMGKGIGADYQREFFKLRQQEYAPLRKANFGGLARLGLALNVNDVPYFNFQSYIQYKMVARLFPSDPERREFSLRVGRKLLAKIAPAAPAIAFLSAPSPDFHYKSDPESEEGTSRAAMPLAGGAMKIREEGPLPSRSTVPDLRLLTEPSFLASPQHAEVSPYTEVYDDESEGESEEQGWMGGVRLPLGAEGREGGERRRVPSVDGMVAAMDYVLQRLLDLGFMTVSEDGCTAEEALLRRVGAAGGQSWPVAHGESHHALVLYCTW